MAFWVFEFAVPVTASSGLGEGIEAAFSPVNDREADIDPGFDELGGDEDDGLAGATESFGFIKHGHDVSRTHAGGEMEGVGVLAEFLMQGLGSFGGVEDKETPPVGIF